jgi:hypothetical protein
LRSKEFYESDFPGETHRDLVREGGFEPPKAYAATGDT